jgi:hypothetical protein
MERSAIREFGSNGEDPGFHVVPSGLRASYPCPVDKPADVQPVMILSVQGKDHFPSTQLTAAGSMNLC